MSPFTLLNSLCSSCKVVICKPCAGVLRGNGEILSVTFNEEIKSVIQGHKGKDTFLEMLNRGGLCKPNDLVYVIGMHGWNFLRYIFTDQDAKNFFLKASEPRKVFVEALLSILESNELTLIIVEMEGAEKHPFKPILLQLVAKLFNIFMKGKYSEENSLIHSHQKRSCYQNDSGERKIKKLQSSNKC